MSVIIFSLPAISKSNGTKDVIAYKEWNCGTNGCEVKCFSYLKEGQTVFEKKIHKLEVTYFSNNDVRFVGNEDTFTNVDIVMNSKSAFCEVKNK